ncbi:aminotransferase class I/II-fold pyridoxal phosphate-dependent enzyme [Candidatus Poribacteria bacterium]|nr:aminotransferase class I/II-fold pyridoxal phosphate-dependent enzyme [Candidatus Poribacteria bacterium]
MDYMKKLLKALKEENLYPDIRTVNDVPYPELIIEGRRYLCFCSNNYLGLSIHPEVKKAAIEAIQRFGIGTCESRIIAGNLSILEELEQAIADFKKEPAAMVFLSGFMANIGIIPGVMDSFEGLGMPAVNNDENLIIRDYLCHTSIIEGCRLSKSPTKTYLHNNMEHLEKILSRNEHRRKLIITDGVFSMDGDMAPLPDIIYLAKQYNAMVMIDDAHATGVIGKNGRGTPEHFDVEGQIDLVMGTLSKAIGALGGYLTSSREVIDLLKVKARSYVFSSSLPPEQVYGIIKSLQIIQNKPELRERLWKNIDHLKSGLKSIGFKTVESETQIIPIIIGDEEKSKKMARLMFDMGILAPSVTYPAVPEGKSRIRCTVMATHTPQQIDKALEAFQVAGDKLGIIGKVKTHKREPIHVV